jgi:hypothetical protein
MDTDSVSIFVFPGRPDSSGDRRIREFSNASEGLFDLACLDGELLVVGDVLVGATAASAEIRAARFDPVRGGGFDGDKGGLEKLPFALMTRAVTSSLVIVKGTNTTWPSWRPTPSPPNATSSMRTRRVSMEKEKEAFVSQRKPLFLNAIFDQ